MSRSFGAKLGLRADRYALRRFTADASDPTPEWIDYSYGFKIDDQGELGTCVSYATRKLFDFFAMKRGHSLTVSPRAIYSTAKSQFFPGDTTDDGLAVSDGPAIVEQFYVNESAFPSTDNSSEADFPQWLEPVPSELRNTDFLLKTMTAVEINPQQFEMALHQHGPIIFGVSFLEGWMNPDSRGIVPDNAGEPVGGHCIVITGYSRNLDGTSRPYFKVANSWGTDFGRNGFFFLPYEAIVPNVTDAFTVVAP